MAEETIPGLLTLLSEHVKLGEPVGCGNWHCRYGCRMGYEDVPNPHVFGSIYLSFEHDMEKGWRWEVEIVPNNKKTGAWSASGDDPLELLRRAYAWVTQTVV